MSNDNILDALLEERRGYEQSGKKDRLAAVDAEIARLKRAQGGAPAPVDADAKPRVSRRKGDG